MYNHRPSEFRSDSISLGALCKGRGEPGHRGKIRTCHLNCSYGSGSAKYVPCGVRPSHPLMWKSSSPVGTAAVRLTLVQPWQSRPILLPQSLATTVRAPCHCGMVSHSGNTLAKVTCVEAGVGLSPLLKLGQPLYAAMLSSSLRPLGGPWPAPGDWRGQRCRVLGCAETPGSGLCLSAPRGWPSSPQPSSGSFGAGGWPQEAELSQIAGLPRRAPLLSGIPEPGSAPASPPAFVCVIFHPASLIVPSRMVGLMRTSPSSLETDVSI